MKWGRAVVGNTNEKRAVGQVESNSVLVACNSASKPKPPPPVWRAAARAANGGSKSS